MTKFRLLSYQDVLGSIGTTKHLLLGNGYSISCDNIFSYTNLFEFARKHGLSTHLCRIFEHLGTSNFEGVLKLLDHAKWLRNHYEWQQSQGRNDTPEDDSVQVKGALVQALTETHLRDTTMLSEEKKRACSQFLAAYHNVFTTNYDLLLYWVNLSDQNPLKRIDGFGASHEEPDAPYVVWQERARSTKALFFLHGALHLYFREGEVRKHCWSRTKRPLIELIKDGLANDEYPLFVAEGKSEHKFLQIQNNPYLAYCLGKLQRIESPLVIFGHAMGESDQHIATALARAEKLTRLFVGLHGNPQEPSARATIMNIELLVSRRNQLRATNPSLSQLHIEYFDSHTVPCWRDIVGDTPSTIQINIK